jgi:hypothetical protein
MPFNLGYNIGDEVLVVPIDIPGIIEGIQIDRKGTTYYVIYENGDKRYGRWLTASEIRKGR